MQELGNKRRVQLFRVNSHAKKQIIILLLFFILIFIIIFFFFLEFQRKYVNDNDGLAVVGNLPKQLNFPRK